MRELFQFTFNIPNLEADIVQFFIFADTAQDACALLRQTGALQQDYSDDDLISKIIQVYQITSDAEEETPKS
jgi:hypothetical protein